jgi:ABC-type glycerol-3-phosphate transport system substrate-binding protein
MTMIYIHMALLGLLVFGSSTRANAAETKPAWQANWEQTVAAAKKEGRLNFYVGRYGSEPLLNEFRKEFPEIKLVTVNGAGNTLGTRIITEIRAGHVVADLFSGGANTNYEVLYEGKALDSIKSLLLLPEVLDESKWYEGRHRYTDAEQRHVFIYIANPSSSGFYYNSNLVNPKEIKSYWDLLSTDPGAKDDSPASARDDISPSNPPVYHAPPVITSLSYSPDSQQLVEVVRALPRR